MSASDVANPIPHAERVKRYIELGKQWSQGHKNRMIKVPATDNGLGALEELAAAGITLNVTLIFSERQYKLARDAVWRGAQRRPGGPSGLKSVYSIFVSRVDVYTEKNVPELGAGPHVPDHAQGELVVEKELRRLGQGEGDGLADAPTAAGNDRMLALQSEVHGILSPWRCDRDFVASGRIVLSEVPSRKSCQTYGDAWNVHRRDALLTQSELPPTIPEAFFSVGPHAP